MMPKRRDPELLRTPQELQALQEIRNRLADTASTEAALQARWLRAAMVALEEGLSDSDATRPSPDLPSTKDAWTAAIDAERDRQLSLRPPSEA